MIVNASRPTENEPRLTIRELRPWLWLPVAAAVFLLVLNVACSGTFEVSELVLLDVSGVLASLLTGLLATRLRGLSFGSWGAAGLFLVLTLCAHVGCSALLVLAGPAAWGGGAMPTAESVVFALLLPFAVLMLTFWLSLPIGAAAGLLAWTLADRSRRRRLGATPQESAV